MPLLHVHVLCKYVDNIKRCINHMAEFGTTFQRVAIARLPRGQSMNNLIATITPHQDVGVYASFNCRRRRHGYSLHAQLRRLCISRRELGRLVCFVSSSRRARSRGNTE